MKPILMKVVGSTHNFKEGDIIMYLETGTDNISAWRHGEDGRKKKSINPMAIRPLTKYEQFKLSLKGA